MPPASATAASAARDAVAARGGSVLERLDANGELRGRDPETVASLLMASYLGSAKSQKTRGGT